MRAEAAAVIETSNFLGKRIGSERSRGNDGDPLFREFGYFLPPDGDQPLV
jgi:hypothetical protein